MHILVTGGAGFIGGHLAERFIANAHSVWAIDCLFDNYAVDIKRRTIERARGVADETTGRYRFVEADILNREIVDEQLAWANVVFQSGPSGCPSERWESIYLQRGERERNDEYP